MSSSHLCNVCEQPSSSRCSRCKLVYYCSKECQVTDWKSGHKKQCKKKSARKKQKTKKPKNAPLNDVSTMPKLHYPIPFYGRHRIDDEFSLRIGHMLKMIFELIGGTKLKMSPADVNEMIRMLCTGVFSTSKYDLEEIDPSENGGVACDFDSAQIIEEGFTKMWPGLCKIIGIDENIGFTHPQNIWDFFTYFVEIIQRMYTHRREKAEEEEVELKDVPLKLPHTFCFYDMKEGDFETMEKGQIAIYFISRVYTMCINRFELVETRNSRADLVSSHTPLNHDLALIVCDFAAPEEAILQVGPFKLPMYVQTENDEDVQLLRVPRGSTKRFPYYSLCLFICTPPDSDPMDYSKVVRVVATQVKSFKQEHTFLAEVSALIPGCHFTPAMWAEFVHEVLVARNIPLDGLNSMCMRPSIAEEAIHDDPVQFRRDCVREFNEKYDHTVFDNCVDISETMEGVLGDALGGLFRM